MSKIKALEVYIRANQHLLLKCFILSIVILIGVIVLYEIIETILFEYHDRKLRKEGVLLKILPKESASIAETGKLIKNIHSMLLNTKLRKILYGRPYMSFEIAAVEGKINFYIWVPKDMKDRIIDRIYATYPEISIKPANEYICDIKGKSKKLYSYGAEMGLGYHHTLKIKTKGDTDIIPGLLAGMKDLGKDETTAVQVIVRPLDNKWQQKGRRKLEKFEYEGIRPGEKGCFIDKAGSAFNNVLGEVDREFQREGVHLDLAGSEVKSNRKSKFDRREITAGSEKLMESGFETVIRVVATGSYRKGNTARIKAITAAFSELDEENRFKKNFIASQDYFYWQFKNRMCYLYGKENIFSTSELANFFLRLPGFDTLQQFPDIEALRIKEFAYPKGSEARVYPVIIDQDNQSGVTRTFDMSSTGIILAKNTYRGMETSIEIKDEDLKRHVVVQGKTGSGKSEWIKTLFLNHISNVRDKDGNIIRAGRGAMVLEPHGKLADELLELIPADRRKDTIVVDLFSDYPVPFNFCKVLDRKDSELTYDQLVQKTVDESIEIFKRTFSDVWSEKNEFFIRNAISTIIETGNTMVEMPRLFTDKKFREKMIKKIKNPKVKQFWISKFKLNSKGQIDPGTESTINSVEYKLEKFLNSKELLRAVGQNDCIDFKDILDNDKIVIFKMSKDKMSMDKISFIGGIAIKMLTVGAFARDKKKWDTPFVVCVDEAQNFISESFKDIYYELRKFGVGLILMHQELEQLNKVPGLVNAIYNNVGTSITFTAGKLDAPFFEGIYGPRVDQKDLMNLPSRYGYCKLLVNGQVSDTFNIYSVDRPEVSKETGKKSVNEILEYNKQGRLSAEEIDKMIEERMSDTSIEDDEDIGFSVELPEGERESKDLVKDNKKDEKSVWDN